jgi:hypothetical protein
MKSDTINNEAIHTFPNGEQLFADQMAELDERFYRVLEASAKANGKPPSSVATALLLSSSMVTGINQGMGGVPSSVYLLFGEEGPKAFIAPAGENGADERSWHPFSQALYSASIRSLARNLKARFCVNVSTTFGEVAVVDNVSKSSSRPMKPSEAASLLVRVAAYDLESDAALRWWLRAGPTGDSERPLHLVPVHMDPMAERFDWNAHWEWATNEGVGTDKDVLPPGVEDLTELESIGDDVDLRSHVMNSILFEAGDELDEGKVRLLKHATKDIGVSYSEALAMVGVWASLVMQDSKKPTGLKPRPNFKARGMRA